MSIINNPHCEFYLAILISICAALLAILKYYYDANIKAQNDLRDFELLKSTVKNEVELKETILKEFTEFKTIHHNNEKEEKDDYFAFADDEVPTEPICSINIGSLHKLWEKRIKSGEWSIETSDYDKFCKLWANSKRIFVIGPYKAGKSTIIGHLLHNKSLGNQIVHTKGLNVYLKEEDNGTTLLIDSEGFYQPVDSESPFQKQDFIIELMKQSCDLLIIVLDKLTTNDVKPLRSITEFYQSNDCIRQLYVVHNIKTITDPKVLDSYLENICKFYHGDIIKGKKDCKIMRTYTQTQSQRAVKPIDHMVMGHYNNLGQLFRDQIGRLNQSISGLAPVQVIFSSSIKRAITITLFKYYSIEYNLIRTAGEESNNTVIIDGDLKIESKNFEDKSRNHQLNLDQLQSSSLNLYWFIEDEHYSENYKSNYVTVVVDCAGIFGRIDVEIVTSSCIQVTGMKKRKDTDDLIELLEQVDIDVRLREDDQAVIFCNKVSEQDDGTRIFHALTSVNLEKPKKKHSSKRSPVREEHKDSSDDDESDTLSNF
jgi:GTP-binding protein EngB required for normal cell division